jgi:hypothetical protein
MSEAIVKSFLTPGLASADVSNPDRQLYLHGRSRDQFGLPSLSQATVKQSLRPKTYCGTENFLFPVRPAILQLEVVEGCST